MSLPPFEFYREHAPLAPLTYYHVGGPATLALAPRNAEEAAVAYQWMHAQPGRKLILGAGSNVLISGAGFPGIVLLTNRLTRLEALGGDRHVSEAGVPLNRLIREVMIPNNYQGTGALAGIPGLVGGAVFMNAGTVNGSTCEFAESVDLITPQGPRRFVMEPSAYGYRSQRFCAPDDLVLRAVFRFQRSDQDQQAIYNRYIQRRLEKQPQGFCCGSVFRNPENDHAARLIEACGLKGAERGGAVISPLHANFIMNERGATFDDILGLIELCKQRVREQFDVDLEEEVRIIR